MAQLTPVRIAQLLSKKPQDPITANDWNDAMGMFQEQGNELSAQVQYLQTQLAGLVSDTINAMIASGTLTLTNVDAGKLQGHDASYFVPQDTLTSLSATIASTYAPLINFNNLNTSFTALTNRAQSCAKISTTAPSLQNTGDIWLEPVS
jgi:hypothetical protein